jgi:hypothetical protein
MREVDSFERNAYLNETDNLLESVGSIADDFREYENLWD